MRRNHVQPLGLQDTEGKARNFETWEQVSGVGQIFLLGMASYGVYKAKTTPYRLKWDERETKPGEKKSQAQK